MTLEIELVPRSAWYSNVRSNVSKKDWETCKAFVRNRSGARCEICGGVGKRYPVDCHEIWSYDEATHIQTLVGLIALCPDCHMCKHFGRAEATGNLERAIGQLIKANNWTDDQVVAHIENAYDEWDRRSAIEWELDLSFLSTLGIEVRNNS